MTRLRALLLALCGLISSTIAQAACPPWGSPELSEVTIYTGISSDPAYSAALVTWNAANPGNCGAANIPFGEVGSGMYKLVGYLYRGAPTSCSDKSGTGFSQPFISIRIADLSVDPKQGCWEGCAVDIQMGQSMKSCDRDTGACHASGGASGTFNGAACDPNVPVTSGATPPPDPTKPKDPLAPNTKPIDNPDGIFPGCKNNTDPGCVLEKLPPGCKKSTSTTPTGGVKETTVCEEVTCSPSICKKVSTSDDKSWATGGGFKAGDPPDEQTTKTTETLQPRTGTGQTSGAGAAGGNGTGTNGGSSSGVGLSDLNGDGFMDGDTDKDGTCDVNCNKDTGAEDGSYCAENPTSKLCEKEDKSGCDKDSKNIGCMEPGTPPDDKIPKTTKTLSLLPSPVSFSGGGGCPSPVTVSLAGAGVTLIDPGPVCNTISSYFRPVVLLIAAFASMMIVIRAGV